VEHRPLHKVDIQISIVVVVEECSASSHDLRQEVFAGGTGEMVKGQSNLGSCIAEERLSRRTSRQKPRRGNQKQKKKNTDPRPPFASYLHLACSNTFRSRSINKSSSVCFSAAAFARAIRAYFKPFSLSPLREYAAASAYVNRGVSLSSGVSV